MHDVHERQHDARRAHRRDAARRGARVDPDGRAERPARAQHERDDDHRANGQGRVSALQLASSPNAEIERGSAVASAARHLAEQAGVLADPSAERVAQLLRDRDLVPRAPQRRERGQRARERQEVPATQPFLLHGTAIDRSAPAPSRCSTDDRAPWHSDVQECQQALTALSELASMERALALRPCECQRVANNVAVRHLNGGHQT